MQKRRTIWLALTGAVLATAVTSGAAIASRADTAKPGPTAPVPTMAGTPAADTAALAKPGTTAGLPTSIVSDKAIALPAGADLAGYSVVDSGSLANPKNAQSYGLVNCPAGKVAFDGGVVASSYSLYQNLNSSYPIVSSGLATGWQAYVNNRSAADSTFVVYAVCAKKPANYAVVSAAFANGSYSQSNGSVQCPLNSSGRRMRVLGGGSYGELSSLAQNINSTYPSGKDTWRVDNNNGSGTSALFKVYAVCGNKAGWTIAAGAPTANPSGEQSLAAAACPSDKISVGGGVFSNSSSTAVNLNTSWPKTQSSWMVYENNADPTDATITPYAVCLS